VLSYTLSVLYMNGVKNGDYQATASGMSVATFFLCISWAKPLRRLSSKRPHTSVFHKSLLLSVLGQFLIHLATIAYAVSLATPYAHVDAVLAEVRGAERVEPYPFQRSLSLLLLCSLRPPRLSQHASRRPRQCLWSRRSGAPCPGKRLLLLRLTYSLQSRPQAR